MKQERTLIKIEDLSFSYRKDSNEINNFSAKINEGEWVSFIGPNGSGKSTLVKIILKINRDKKTRFLRKHIDSCVIVNDKPINHWSNREYSKLIAYIPQINDVPDGVKVFDFVSFGRNPWMKFGSRMSSRDVEIVENAMREIGITTIRDKYMEQLSGGQRQKVYIALALAQDTPVIILDEPTTFLDIRAQCEVLEILSKLHKKGITIITVLHDVNQAAQYSDWVIVVKEGKVYSQGKPNNILTERLINEVYDIKAKMVEVNGKKYITTVEMNK
jgi:ABC-type cobalamin/Fe3+-siderophores transport system ATPase subunit